MAEPKEQSIDEKDNNNRTHKAAFDKVAEYKSIYTDVAKKIISKCKEADLSAFSANAKGTRYLDKYSVRYNNDFNRVIIYLRSNMRHTFDLLLTFQVKLHEYELSDFRMTISDNKVEKLTITYPLDDSDLIFVMFEAFTKDISEYFMKINPEN